MSTAWSGGNPTEALDPDDYELGTEWLVSSDLTISALRVWAGAGELNLANRKGRIWTTAGSQVGIASLPDDLPTGWSEHALDTPVPVLAGTSIVTSFSTGGNEGALPGALTGAVVSADGAVTAKAAGLATNGNGIYNLTHGSFPSNGSGSQAFYGADFVYTLGIGGNTAPSVTLTAVAHDLAVTVTAALIDAETLVGAGLRFIWGDGTADTTVSYPTVSATHTYARAGHYAVAVIVTDAGGLTDTAAVVATPRDAVAGGVIELAQADLTSALKAALPNQYRVVQFGREPQPPSFAIAPPTLRWESTCPGDPTSATFAVCVVERQDERAFERLRQVIPTVALAIDNVREASVINAAPTTYPGSAVELPCYVFTVEVSL